MIHVAHVLPHMAVGGRERIVADLCRTAADYGIAARIVTYDPLPAGAATIDTGGTSIVALDRSAPDFLTRLRIALADVDLVHAQGHIAAALLPEIAQPVVTTIHVALGEGWRWLPAIRAGLRRATVVTAVSDDLAARFRWMTREPIHVVPTGIDLERFTPAQPDNDVFTIGIAARLHPVKRHLDLIEAMHLLKRDGVRARLRIAGEGTEHARIAEAAWGLDVSLLGAVGDMPAFYGRLDAFALPSDHEGTPAALIEAMASGLPCVVTRVGGMPDVVGDAGIVVHRRDPAAIADALALIARLRPALSEMARSRAAQFGLAPQAVAYAALYRRLAAQRRHVAA